MANRDNHYEAAFEAYLRRYRLPYVAVDESRRALMSDTSLKSLDFIVSAGEQGSWLIDVKGRRFPSGDEHKCYWKNWSTRDDLRSLALWRRQFGESFSPLLVFAYHLVADRSPLPAAQSFVYREQSYAFVAIDLESYAASARLLSPKWDTVFMPTAEFRAHAVACDELWANSDAIA